MVSRFLLLLISFNISILYTTHTNLLKQNWINQKTICLSFFSWFWEIFIISKLTFFANFIGRRDSVFYQKVKYTNLFCILIISGITIGLEGTFTLFLLVFKRRTNYGGVVPAYLNYLFDFINNNFAFFEKSIMIYMMNFYSSIISI